MANINNTDEEIAITYEQLANGYTFNDLVSSINALGLNVRATYDSVQDRFSLYNRESGFDNEIRLAFREIDTTDLSGTTLTSAIAQNTSLERTANFFNQLGLRQTANGELDNTAGNGLNRNDIDYIFHSCRHKRYC